MELTIVLHRAPSCSIMFTTKHDEVRRSTMEHDDDDDDDDVGDCPLTVSSTPTAAGLRLTMSFDVRWNYDSGGAAASDESDHDDSLPHSFPPPFHRRYHDADTDAVDGDGAS